MSSGPTLTSIAAVPGSTRCSAAVSSAFQAPNHSRPQASRRPASPRAGSGSRCGDDPSERGGADQQAPERQRAGRELAPGGADADERDARSATVTRAAASGSASERWIECMPYRRYERADS
jgi:hypothetical protein